MRRGWLSGRPRPAPDSWMGMPLTKRCPDCGETKERNAFSPRAGYCKPCASARQRVRYAKDPTRQREYAAAYRAQNKDRVRAAKIEAYKKSPDKYKDKELRWRYGLSLAGLREMMERQGGCCRICGGELQGGRATHIDHCHATGVVRSVLCHNCNTGLGGFRDSPEIMARAIEYVTEWRRRADQKTA